MSEDKYFYFDALENSSLLLICSAVSICVWHDLEKKKKKEKRNTFWINIIWALAHLLIDAEKKQ